MSNSEDKKDKKAKKGNRSMLFVLTAVSAALLLVAIITVGVMLISGAAIVTDDRGKTTVVFGGNDKSDPFRRSEQTVQSTSGESTIVIEDPPESGVSTSPAANPGELSVSQIAKTVRPSVVGITVVKNGGSAVASGVILSTNGYIVTSAAVVADASDITVVTENGEMYSAELVGADTLSDVAVVRINAEALDAATFGNSDAVEVGDLAVAIGTPYSISLMGTTTSGIISAINRDIIIEGRVMTLLQTDAYIAEGCAGGAIVNRFGQVVGIISLSLNDTFDGIGFAVPMNTAKPIIEDIINGSLSKRPSLGITGQFFDGETAGNLGLPTGLYVHAVWTGSDAFAKGIRTGDLIVALDGITVTDLASYNQLQAGHDAGDTVELRIYRDDDLYDGAPGEYLTVSVEVGYIE